MRLRSVIPGFTVEVYLPHTFPVALYRCMSCGAELLCELHDSPDALEAPKGMQAPEALRAHVAEHES